MGLSYKQVRYLWAVGYFKSGGAKGKVKSIAKVEPKSFPDSWEANQYARDHLTSTHTMPNSEHKLALSTYRGADYKDINGVARGRITDPGKIERYTPLNKLLDEAISTSIPTPHPIMLHRGISGEFSGNLMKMHNEGTLIGSVIKDGGFLSTSLTKKVASDFATNGDNPIVISMSAPKGTKGVSIQGSEAEFLLGRDRKVRITGIELHPGKYEPHIIHAELVN